MNLKFLLKATGIALLSSLALADDCKDIKSYIQGRDKSYSKNIEFCEVDSKGKVKTLYITNINLDEKDITKLTSYDTIEKFQYLWGIVDDDDNEDGYQTTELDGFPKTLSKLTNLKELSLKYYGLREYDRAAIKDDVLKVSKTLEKLTLNGVQLSENNIKDIAKLTNLKELHIYRFFERVNLDALKSLTSLKSLTIVDAHHNPYEEIPSVIFSLSKLQSLSISGQDISSIPSELSKLKNLETLDLTSNHLSGDIPESLNNLQNLKILNLTNNSGLTGKTLTIKSLDVCSYDHNAKLCKPKDMDCFDSEDPFKLCDETSTTTKKPTTTTTDKTPSIATDIPTSTNGRCGKDAGKCPKNECCSKYGWCGTEEDHCSVEKGCQSEFGRCDSSSTTKKSTTTKKTTTTTTTKKTTTTPSTIPTSTNGRCGKGVGKCPKDECCSQYGWCGTQEDHCSVAKGCQSEFGRCNSSSTTKKSTTTKKTTTKKTTTTTKKTTTTTKKTTTKKSIPTSTNGKCGKNEGKCPKGECCSKYGWCGTEENYCSLKKGCQSEFGKCN